MTKLFVARWCNAPASQRDYLCYKTMIFNHLHHPLFFWCNGAACTTCNIPCLALPRPVVNVSLPSCRAPPVFVIPAGDLFKSLMYPLFIFSFCKGFKLFVPCKTHSLPFSSCQVQPALPNSIWPNSSPLTSRWSAVSSTHAAPPTGTALSR